MINENDNIQSADSLDIPKEEFVTFFMLADEDIQLLIEELLKGSRLLP